MKNSTGLLAGLAAGACILWSASASADDFRSRAEIVCGRYSGEDRIICLQNMEPADFDNDPIASLSRRISDANRRSAESAARLPGAYGRPMHCHTDYIGGFICD